MTRILGILNVTPDSFSDGGRSGDEAVAHGEALLRDGADAIDVGGVSTRPNAPEVTEDEEWARLEPVLRKLRDYPLWLDCWRTSVVERAVDYGIRVVNDQRGGESPGLLELIAHHRLGWVCMHNRGTPATMRSLAHYTDVVSEVWAGLDAARAQASGISEVILDPGLGFAKTPEHNLALLRDLPNRTAEPVLIGASRKSFLGVLLDRPDPKDRLAGSLAVAAHAWRCGAAWVRVHDVRETRDLFRTLEALA